MWHIATCGGNGVPRLNYGDGREVVVGETLTVDGEIELCEHGLHACASILDACRYASGSVVCICRVELSGTVMHGDNKSVATERKCVEMLDADTSSRILREFARWCALQVIDLWEAPQTVREYLLSGDENLRGAANDAARSAAWSNANDAARSAAWSDANAAARSAARDAAWAAAWDAANAAARAAANAAAWSAARQAQTEKLMRLVEAAIAAQS